MPEVQERLLLWVAIAGKDRPTIVLHVEAAGAVGIWGTRTRRDSYRSVLVEPKSRAGKTLGLEQPTYFYATNLVAIRPDHVAPPTARRCPPDLFLELRGIVEEQG